MIVGRTIIGGSARCARIGQMNPNKEGSRCISAQPLDYAGDYLIAGTFRGALTACPRVVLEGSVKHIESAIEARSRAISGIQQDRAHKCSGAIPAGMKQIRKIRNSAWQGGS